MGSNGSWTGRDPRLRLLRSLAAIVLLVLISIIVVDYIIDGDVDLGLVGVLMGALIVLLGFESGVRFPGGKE